LIISTIQSIAPYFLDFELTPNKGSFIELRWKDKYSDTIYGVTDLSDGTIRFIALTVLFLQPNLPDTIIIDEPELGLHPTAISKLAGMIKSASLKGSQVIVATQSTDLISHFSPDDIITVDQIDGCSKFNYA
jgi:predicted ATPase